MNALTRPPGVERKAFGTWAWRTDIDQWPVLWSADNAFLLADDHAAPAAPMQAAGARGAGVRLSF